ncbi:MAG: GLPGLI family protein, partial [Chitinophagaceae bacterium]
MHLKLAMLLFFVVGLSVMCSAQSVGTPQFITKGKIEYERKTNQHAYMDENSSWDAMLKKNFPKFITAYFNLSFDNSHTLYTTGKEPEVRQNKFWGLFDPENIVSTQLDSSTILTQKTLFNDTWLISDSVRKIDWKIGTEIRKIAGFDCRKAVGKVLDSIIVIAFYTDEILT